MISHSLSSCRMPWPCPFRTFSSCLSAPHVIPGLITSNPLPAPMTPSVLVLLEELCDFLTSHPSITQLCIDREVSHQHLALPPSALPTLETYLGSCSLMLTPLQHPKHIPEIEIEDVIHMLAKATFPMCHLGCTTFGAATSCSPSPCTCPSVRPCPHTQPPLFAGQVHIPHATPPCPVILFCNATHRHPLSLPAPNLPRDVHCPSPLPGSSSAHACIYTCAYLFPYM